MSLYINSGNIYISDASGRTVFDSNEKLFQVTNTLSGSVQMPYRQAIYTTAEGTNYDVNVSQYTTIGYCHPSSNVVLGSVRVAVTDGKGLAHVTGYGNADGTYVHYQTATKIGGKAKVLSAMVTYTFYASGGVVGVYERTVMCAQRTTRTSSIFVDEYQGPTLTYYLFVGSFV